MALPVLVIGSSNTDMVVKSSRLPGPGETVIGNTFLMNAGGKGANQAVAAARLGADVTFVTKVGNDVFGQRTAGIFADEKVNTQFVYTDPDHPSGVALIGVDSDGENLIMVAPGANHSLDEEDVNAALHTFTGEAIILMQLEIPMNTVAHVVFHANKQYHKVILNPAPAAALPKDILPGLFLITPNETEAGLLTGIDVNDEPSAIQAAEALHNLGIPNVIITLGKRGVCLSDGSSKTFLSPPPVKAIDTTAAGDCFNGALAAGLAMGMTLAEAAQFGCDAASISVTRMGAQASMPYLNEVKHIQNKN